MLMLNKAGLGLSKKSSSSDAANEAYKNALKMLGDKTPNFIFCFFTEKYSADILLEKINSLDSDIPVFPLCAPAVISSNCSFENGVVILALSSKDLTILKNKTSYNLDDIKKTAQTISKVIIINLNTVIEEYLMSATMIEYQEKYPDVKIIINLDKDLKNISGSTPHLTKVVMNLVCNAFEFLPKGGELTIITSTVNIEKKISGYEEILPGCYSLLKITDTGPGILNSDIKRIFEPYYTKKIHSTTGSGLGLWVVYGIVKEHNAFIDIHSEYGNGTSFYIYFPAHEQKAETEISNKVKSSCGTERILIIDDETEIREFLSDVLKYLNYKVYVAENGRAAVKSLTTQSVDLIILDMIMESDFDGLDTYREILKIHPEQKAIISSGFSINERIKETLSLGAGQFLKKPYTIEELSTAVQKELSK